MSAASLRHLNKQQATRVLAKVFGAPALVPGVGGMDVPAPAAFCYAVPRSCTKVVVPVEALTRYVDADMRLFSARLAEEILRRDEIVDDSGTGYAQTLANTAASLRWAADMITLSTYCGEACADLRRDMVRFARDASVAIDAAVRP